MINEEIYLPPQEFVQKQLRYDQMSPEPPLCRVSGAEPRRRADR